MNENALKWVEALESGEFKQGDQWLCRRLLQETRYCCLGVACEVYRRETGKGEWQPVGDSGAFRFIVGPHWTGRSETSLPEGVTEWLGLRDREGEHRRITGEREALIQLNDSEHKSFIEIAAVIRSEPEGLFVEA